MRAALLEKGGPVGATPMVFAIAEEEPPETKKTGLTDTAEGRDWKALTWPKVVVGIKESKHPYHRDRIQDR